jgi:hypothetical protein
MLYSNECIESVERVRQVGYEGFYGQHRIVRDFVQRWYVRTELLACTELGFCTAVVCTELLVRTECWCAQNAGAHRIAGSYRIARIFVRCA